MEAWRPLRYPTGSLTPAKRSFPETPTEDASRHRSKPPFPVPAGHVSFRLLCNADSVGGVIGKSGAVVDALRKQTGARIHVLDPVPGCDRRVVLVVGAQNPKKTVVLVHCKASDSYSDDDGEDDGGEGEEEVVEVEASAAQEALVRVFERVLLVEEEEASGEEEVSCRIVAEKKQIGAVMGKGGKNIEAIRKANGVKISVLPPDKLPSCASPTDQLILISGRALPVKKAIVAVSSHLQDNPLPKKAAVENKALDSSLSANLNDVHTEAFTSFAGPSSRSNLSNVHNEALTYFTVPSLRSNLNNVHTEALTSFASPSLRSSVVDIGNSHPVLTAHDRRLIQEKTDAQTKISFRLLCTNDKVGRVIGRGGTIIKALQSETGTSIIIGSSVAESDERVITVSASENPEMQYSPTQNAVVRVFRCIVEAGTDRGSESLLQIGEPIICRLLVPADQVGCVIGKGGAVVSEIRRLTGTSVRVIAGGQVPKCASENDEIVQVSGDLNNVQDALFVITGKLRENLFPSKTSFGTEVHSYVHAHVSPLKRPEDTSVRLHQSGAPSQIFDRQRTLTHSINHVGLQNGIQLPSAERLSTSRVFDDSSWSTIDDLRRLESFRDGTEPRSGSSPVVTNTTMEINIPERCICHVYGDNGSNLTKIRQISGAKVVVHTTTTNLGTRETVVFISGTPDQTQLAQTLLNAYISKGQR